MSHPYREMQPMRQMVELTEEEVKRAIGYYVVEHGLIEGCDESKAKMEYRGQVSDNGKVFKLTSLTYWIEEKAP